MKMLILELLKVVRKIFVIFPEEFFLGMLGAELNMSDHCLHALFGSTGFQQLGRLEVVDGPRDATTRDPVI